MFKIKYKFSKQINKIIWKTPEALTKALFQIILHQDPPGLNPKTMWINLKFQDKNLVGRHMKNKSPGLICIDDDKLTSISDDGIIKIWRKSDAKLIQTLSGHIGGVNCLDY